MRKPLLTHRDRVGWRDQEVLDIWRHPAFLHNLASTDSETVRYISADDKNSVARVTETVAQLIRTSTKKEFLFFMGKLLPGILNNTRVTRALEEFSLRPGTSARFILDNKALELRGTEVFELARRDVRELTDPRSLGWRMTGYDTRPLAQRFIVTDEDCWWFNDYGPDVGDVTSSFGVRSPVMARDLRERFEDRYKLFV